MSKAQVLKNTIDFLVQLDQEQTWQWQQTRVKLKAFVNMLHEEIRGIPHVENPLVGTQPPRGNDPHVETQPPHPLVDMRFRYDPPPPRGQDLHVEMHTIPIIQTDSRGISTWTDADGTVWMQWMSNGWVQLGKP
jgi:hypothetical protein